jgi:ribosome-associated toxin RatA of RatAB toxin-antitoxin module
LRVINRSALVPYSPRLVFETVDDIEAYSEFLPWCSKSRVLDRSDSEVVATLVLSASGIDQAFTTKNRLTRYQNIELSLLDGPFSQLHGQWSFEPLGLDGCKMELDLSFEFSNPIVDQTFGRLFGAAADRLVSAFTDRLDRLHD